MTREEILAARQGYKRALKECLGLCSDGWLDEQAAKAYPLAVTRPRVYTSPSGTRFRVVGGILQYDNGFGWVADGMSRAYYEQFLGRHAAIVDLFDHPTETVPEEEA